MILSWIIKIALWALVGWGAGKIMGGKPKGLLMNVLLGLVGGAVGIGENMQAEHFVLQFGACRLKRKNRKNNGQHKGCAQGFEK